MTVYMYIVFTCVNCVYVCVYTSTMTAHFCSSEHDNPMHYRIVLLCLLLEVNHNEHIKQEMCHLNFEDFDRFVSSLLSPGLHLHLSWSLIVYHLLFTKHQQQKCTFWGVCCLQYHLRGWWRHRQRCCRSAADSTANTQRRRYDVTLDAATYRSQDWHHSNRCER